MGCVCVTLCKRPATTLSKDSLSLLPAGAAQRGLSAAVGGGHHGLDGLVQQHSAVEEKRGRSGQGWTKLLTARL